MFPFGILALILPVSGNIIIVVELKALEEFRRCGTNWKSSSQSTRINICLPEFMKQQTTFLSFFLKLSRNASVMTLPGM